MTSFKFNIKINMINISTFKNKRTIKNFQIKKTQEIVCFMKIRKLLKSSEIIPFSLKEFFSK